MFVDNNLKVNNNMSVKMVTVPVPHYYITLSAGTINIDLGVWIIRNNAVERKTYAVS